tara:strand:- start:55 stop:231 length:177 start_codon:yes stop_codon:yes gene_type:complete
MKEIVYAIADLFGILFEGIEIVGNTLNYIYILVIFILLVGWTYKMIQHRKNNEEHAPL